MRDDTSLLLRGVVTGRRIHDDDGDDDDDVFGGGLVTVDAQQNAEVRRGRVNEDRARL